MKKIIGFDCMVKHGRVLYVSEKGYARTISRKAGKGWRRVCPSILGFVLGMACGGYRLW